LVQVLHGPTRPARRQQKAQGGETPPNFGGLRNRPSYRNHHEIPLYAG